MSPRKRRAIGLGRFWLSLHELTVNGDVLAKRAKPDWLKPA